MPCSPGRSRRHALGSVVLITLLGLAPSAFAADFFVDAARGSDGNDGLSWASAKKSVRAALTDAAVAPGHDTVNVARGRYPGTVQIPPDTTLFGGFPIGGGIRNSKINPTILDGMRSGPVVSLGPGTDASVVDGFGIEGGRSSVPTEGGGMTIRGSAARISSCTIEHDMAPAGGGILIDVRGMSMLPMIERCVIRANVASSPGVAGLGGGVYVLADEDAPIDMPLIHDSLLQGNVAELPSGSTTITAGGIYVRGRVRLEHLHVRGNEPSGIVIDGRPTGGSGSVLVNMEISGSSADGLIVGCGSTSVAVDNCTFSRNGGAAIVGRPLAGPAAGGAWEVDLRRSILWDNGVLDLASAPECDLVGENVADSIVQGGHAGTNVVDQDPLFIKGPAMGYYLSSRASGQAIDSVALDAGPSLSQDLGLTAFTTRLDSGLDIGPVDWGAHCLPMPVGGATVYRGTTPSNLLPYATVDFLPLIERPLHDPLVRLLCYSVQDVTSDIFLSKDEAFAEFYIGY